MDTESKHIAATAALRAAAAKLGHGPGPDLDGCAAGCCGSGAPMTWMDRNA